MRRVSISAIACGLCLGLILAGCGGVSQEKLDVAKAQIAELESKGVPDSLLSKPKVFLYQTTTALKTSNSGLARRGYDSLTITLDYAQSWYEATMKQLKPRVASLRAKIEEGTEGLTGLQRAFADSMIGLVDSFTAKNWMLQAEQKASALEQTLPLLQEDEKKAQRIRKRLPGRWRGRRVIKEPGKNAVEKRELVFKTDGSIQVTEEMRGQTSEYLKEDWKFISWGTYDIKGDTIKLFIEREKCPRQTFWNYRDGKGWVKEDQPTYDSTITNGSKDRFMTYDYVTEYFSKR